METIGLIAAMTQESDALLRFIKGSKRIMLGSLPAQCFELSGWYCLLVTSGMGIRRAREATRTLVELKAPRTLISFGIAGAVEADLDIGDVIAADTAYQLDKADIRPLLPLEPWPGAAREAITQALASRGARLFEGTAITTGGSQVNENQLGRLSHPILEMETAGILQIATEKGIPLLSLRAISDGPRSPIPLNLTEIMDEDANLKAGKMLAAILRHPGIILQSRQLMHNSRVAADNAAAALLAGLSQL